MNIKEVKDLIHEVLHSDISEFELEHTGTRIRLKRGLGGDVSVRALAPSQLDPSAYPSYSASDSNPAAPLPEVAESEEERSLHIITSPIVGTIYFSPSPGSDPFVKMGDHVRVNAVLCIVEAMKLMNEIPTDVEGDIVRIYVENGNPVEFGQKLFAIRPSIQG